MKAESIVNSMTNLATLPTIYQEVDKVVSDPNSDANQLGKVINTDQVITAQILKLVNSALYGFPGKIETVGRAITIIGFKQTKDLVLAASVINSYKDSPASEFIDMMGFWRYSIASAIFARKLADFCRMANSEALFTAGLVHDLGRVVLLENYKTLPVLDTFKNSRENQTLLYKEEKALIGCDHCEIAEVLFKKWNLPKMLQEAIRQHHSPTMSLAFPKETFIVHASEFLAQALFLGNSGDCVVPPCHVETWVRLELSKDDLDTIIRDTLKLLPEMTKVLLD